MLNLSHVNKSFYDDKQNNNKRKVLSGLSLAIDDNEIVCIIGPSGCGKTTLLKIMNLIENPSSGIVKIDNKIADFNNNKCVREIRKNIANISQSYDLLSRRTVLENVCLPLELRGVDKLTRIKQAKSALDNVWLQEYYHEYPETLSGGQQQRVAIARAIVGKPKLLLCDELTSALDKNSEKQICKILQNIQSKLKIPVVIVTHSIEVIRYLADRVIVIDHGNIVESAGKNEILANPQSDFAKKVFNNSVFLQNINIEEEYYNLIFHGTDIEYLHLYEIKNKYNVTVRLINSNISSYQNKLRTFVNCSFKGDKSKIKLSLQYLADNNIGVEEYDHVK